MTDNKTLVVGLGNPILGDDGVGWRVVEAVKVLRPSLEVDCLALGGLSLMERLIGYDRAIIVDAIHTGHGRTGTVTTFPLHDLPDHSAGHTTAVHDLSLPTALALGRQMGAQLPEEITIVGIEADRVYDFSEELSTAVQDAIPVAVTAVLTEIERLGD
ncbi:MAG: hydrogenase maturation protease [Anaerolineae bacterium]|nr:hydrogenase maturation protease [Anaerolineae bacterium]